VERDLVVSNVEALFPQMLDQHEDELVVFVRVADESRGQLGTSL
jgi:hypothetical protein